MVLDDFNPLLFREISELNNILKLKSISEKLRVSFVFGIDTQMRNNR